MQPVRMHIVEILKASGGATVAELAERLGLAQVSVRHHLDILIGEDLVETAGLRRRDGAGRPSQLYTLTAAAAKLFPQRHSVLAVDVLTEMKALLPDEEFHGLLGRLAEKASRRAPAATAYQSFEERLEDVTEFLTAEGYAANWQRTGEGYLVRACNCPHAGVVDHHPELCSMDQLMFQILLPGAVRVESQALDGAAQCTYVVPLAPADRASWA